MKSNINVSSEQAMQISTKIRNTPTSYMHIVIQIMLEIFLTYSLSYQQLASLMVSSLTGEPRKIWEI